MEGGRRLFLGELPLRGATRWREGGGCFWGSSRCAGLLDGGREEAVSRGAPAARGCSMEGGRKLFLGELPLRGAARWREGRAQELSWGAPSPGCAGLHDGGREEAISEEAPAARGCSMEGGKSSRAELGSTQPRLRGAARWREGGGCF